MNDRMTRSALAAAVAVPILYYGVQLLTAPFFPGYSFLANTASQLGSDRSTLPAIFNIGAMLTGATALVAAAGLFRGLSLQGIGPVRSALVAFTVVSMGVSGLWAGSYPLPDPRHNPGWLGAGTFFIPLAFPIAAWGLPRSRGLKIYLLLNLLAFAATAPVMSGATPIDMQRFGGLFQRIAAGLVYLPVGVLGYALLRRMRSVAS